MPIFQWLRSPGWTDLKLSSQLVFNKVTTHQQLQLFLNKAFTKTGNFSRTVS